MVYLLVFVIVKWCDFGVNLNFVDPSNPSYVPLFKASCPALAGMLSLAFFIHNCIVTIMKNNRNQTNNVSDKLLAALFRALPVRIVGNNGCIAETGSWTGFLLCRSDLFSHWRNFLHNLSSGQILYRGRMF